MARVVLRAFGKGSASRRRVNATAGPRTSSACRMRGWSSPKAASSSFGPRESTPERPGWNQAGAARLQHQRRWRADRGQRRLGIGAGVPEVDRPPGAMAAARRRGADPHAGRQQRLLARLAAGKDLADLEERQIGEAPRLVAGSGAQQARQQVRSQVAHLRADRVLEPHRLAAAAEELGRRLVDEAVGDALVEAERRDPPARLSLAALHRRQDRPGDAGGPRQRPTLEPAQRRDAGDLLDEIGLALHVRPPGRHERHAVRARRSKPSAVRIRSCSASGISMPTRRSTRAGSRRKRRVVSRHRAGDLDLGRLAAAELEDRSASRARCPSGVKAGSTPRSKR